MKLRWRSACTALGLFLGLNLIAVTWAEARVRETVEERGLELGRELHRVSSLMDAFEGTPPRGRAGGAHRLVVNGAEVALHSGSVRLTENNSLEKLARRVRNNCRAVARGGTEATELMRAPVIQWIGEDEAFVYCLKAERALSLEALSEMLAAFSESGDLSRLGTFQGAYFRANGGSVSILTAEIKRGLDPAAMFPDERDAPGAHLPGLPRPPGRRVLSVGHNGLPALNIHHVEGSALSTLDAYHQRLVGAGLSVERATLERGDGLALLARSAQEAFLVVAQDAARGSQMVLARLPD